MSLIYIPKKCGVNFSPPALVVLYEDTIKMKMRKYVMPVRNFRSSSNVNFVAEDLKARHNKVLESVPIITIEKMLRILQENLKGAELEKAIEIVNKEFSVSEEEDLNKLNGDSLRRKKEMMELEFNKSRVRPSDPNFVYDKRVNFTENTLDSGWDTEVDDFWNLT